MMIKLARFMKAKDGATAIEYGLIAGLIAMAIVIGATALGNSINGEFTGIGETLNDSMK